ncbi:hypothetical protein CMI49_00085 [Candidatus Pacearchaeota archaeon]|jgi:hypothetical protein|nr:hypothetical protein [Candidatus Pacearchaeota archaeon]
MEMEGGKYFATGFLCIDICLVLTNSRSLTNSKKKETILDGIDYFSSATNAILCCYDSKRTKNLKEKNLDDFVVLMDVLEDDNEFPYNLSHKKISYEEILLGITNTLGTLAQVQAGKSLNKIYNLDEALKFNRMLSKKFLRYNERRVFHD